MPDVLHFNDSAEEENFTKEATVCIRSTIKRLPEKYREALELTEFQGLSQKELSEKARHFLLGSKIKGTTRTEKIKTAA